MQKQTLEPSYRLFCVNIKEICKKENNAIYITCWFLNNFHKTFNIFNKFHMSYIMFLNFLF